MPQPSLKAQDLVIGVKIAVSTDQRFTYAAVASDVGLAPSRVHASVQMLIKSRLASGNTKEGVRVSGARLQELIIHGVPYFFPAIIGGPSRGMATGTALEALRGELVPSIEAQLVWPDAEGAARGNALTPIHPSVLTASKRDKRLYEIFMAIDVLRVAGSRERDMAVRFIKSSLT